MQSTASSEWKTYWPVVLAASLGFSFMSIMTPAAGIFMEPLAKEFGWNKTQLSAGIGIAGILSVITSPFCGMLIDKVGARRVALPGLIATALAVAAFGMANGSVTQWIILWIIWGSASLFVQSTVWSTVVTSVFESGRGLALGLTLSGTALAQTIVPPLTNWLISSYGWRIAYATLGFGWGSIALLVCILFLYDARDNQRLKRASHRNNIERKNLPGLTIQQAWRNRQLWMLAISTFLLLFITVSIQVHQFPILVEAGVSHVTAAWLLSLFGIAGIAGKLITGWLLDRFSAQWVGGLTLSITAIAYPFIMVGTPGLIVAAMIISGYSAGTKLQLCGYLTARYGGVRNYGTIFGFMTSAIALAAGLGPLVAGITYDGFGSYTPLLIAGTIIPIISGALIFLLGPYPDWDPQVSGMAINSQ